MGFKSPSDTFRTPVRCLPASRGSSLPGPWLHDRSARAANESSGARAQHTRAATTHRCRPIGTAASAGWGPIPYRGSVLDRITATRYVTPLREGGSLPGIVEADDLGTYVVKFRGAGQGLRVLVGEVIVGLLAERLGLRVKCRGWPSSTCRRALPATRPTKRSRTCSTPAPAPTSASTSSRAPSGTTAPAHHHP